MMLSKGQCSSSEGEVTNSGLMRMYVENEMSALSESKWIWAGITRSMKCHCSGGIPRVEHVEYRQVKKGFSFAEREFLYPEF